MKVLDRYLVGSFAKAFFGTLLVFSIGAVTLDFFSRIGHFMNEERIEGTFAEGWSSTRIVLQFYAAYLPFILKEVLPFVTVAAGLLTVANMLRNNEVFPVLAAGVSARRLFAPLLVCGLLVSLGHLAFQEVLVPALSQRQIALRRFFQGDRRAAVDNLVHLRDGAGTVTRAESFRFDDRTLRDVVIHRPWTERGFERWTVPLLSPAGDGWRAPDGAVVQPAGVAVLPRRLPPGARVSIGVTPSQVEALVSKQGTAELSFTQLESLVASFPARRNLRVALHKQVSRPLTSFVLLLLGVPLLLAAGRSLVLGGGIAFAISAGYYFLDIFFTSLGDRGDLPPTVAAYLPLALLFSLGVAQLATVRT